MAGFKEASDLSLLSFCTNIIDEETFALLYDINSSGNLDLPYDNYEKFDLDNLCDDESKSEFRFYKNDIFHLKEALRIPDQVSIRSKKISSTLFLTYSWFQKTSLNSFVSFLLPLLYLYDYCYSHLFGRP